jgi:hypothetical protein
MFLRAISGPTRCSRLLLALEVINGSLKIEVTQQWALVAALDHLDSIFS